jgi:hypothetical protein
MQPALQRLGLTKIEWSTRRVSRYTRFNYERPLPLEPVSDLFGPNDRRDPACFGQGAERRFPWTSGRSRFRSDAATCPRKWLPLSKIIRVSTDGETLFWSPSSYVDLTKSAAERNNSDIPFKILPEKLGLCCGVKKHCCLRIGYLHKLNRFKTYNRTHNDAISS